VWCYRALQRDYSLICSFMPRSLGVFGEATKECLGYRRDDITRMLVLTATCCGGGLHDTSDLAELIGKLPSNDLITWDG